MINWQTIETALHAWVATASALPDANVLWRDQDVPVETRPQLRLAWIAQDLPIGSAVRDERQRTATAGTERIVHRRRHVLAVTWHADLPDTAATAARAAMPAIGNLARTLQTESVKATIRLAGLAIMRVGNPQDIGAFLDTRYETRAQIEIEFATADTTSDVVGAITTVTPPVGAVTFGGI